VSEEKKHHHQQHHHHAPAESPPPAQERQERKMADKEAPAGTVKIANMHRASIGLPPVHHETKEGMPLRIKHGEQQLTPGDNTVSSEHWAAIKETPVVKNMIESGLLREGEVPKDEESLKTARESLDGVSEERALVLVSNTSDKDQLMKWQQTEKRAAVRELINRRFEAIGQSK
jgi:hypothetical protein